MKDLLEDYLSLAHEAKENLDYKRAITIYNNAYASAEDEDRIEILYELGDLYSEIGEYEKAKGSYFDIINLDPEEPGAWYGIAFTNELSGGDVDYSIEAYENSIKIDPEYVDSYYYLAVLLDDNGHRNRAIENYEKCIELNPEYYRAYNDLGAVYEDEKEYNKALNYFQEALRINPEYDLSHFNMGVVYKALGEYDKAMESYKTAAKYSANEYIYLNMSALLIELKDYQGAIDILTEGIGRNENHLLYYNRACSYRNIGEEERAIRDLESAKAINPVVMEWAKNDPDLKDLFVEEI